MLGYIVFSVCVLVVSCLVFLFFNCRNRGTSSLDSPALASVPQGRQSRRRAAKLLKKARKKNRNITSVELTEDIPTFKPKSVFWKGYYASPVSKRKKYKPKHW